MDINLEFESLDDELEEIYATCPRSWDNKVNMNDLIDQLSVKYGEDIVGLLRQEIGLSSNIVESSVKFDDFVDLMRNFILRFNVNNVDFLSTESIENGNLSNEEFSNHNDELDISSNLEDIKYLRDSKKDISEKLLKAETRVTTLEDCINNYNKKNIQLNKEIESMREDVNKLQLIEIENEELREKLIQLDVKFRHSNDDIKKKSSRIEILEEENDSLTGKINKLQQDLDKKITLLTQNEQNCKLLYEEINLLKEQNSYLVKDAEKATVNSDLNESLHKRIDNLMHEKSNLQFQIAEYELNTVHNFDRLNESSVNEMRMTCSLNNNEGVSLRSELSGIYDPEMEVYKKMERIESGITVSTQTDNVINSVCSQTDILGPELSLERIFQYISDNRLVQEMELCDNTEIINQFEESDQALDLPNLETTCTINLSKPRSYGKNDQKLALPNMEIMSAINPRKNVQTLDIPKFGTAINLSNQSSFRKNYQKVALLDLEIKSTINSSLKSTPLNYVEPRDSLALQKYSIDNIHDRSSKRYSYSFFSYADPRIISNGFFTTLIYLIHEMTKFIGKKFNVISLMIILFSILAYFSFAILVKWNRFCDYYGNDIPSCLIQNWGIKVTYPHGRTM